jgi:hypothetical protein
MEYQNVSFVAGYRTTAAMIRAAQRGAGHVKEEAVWMGQQLAQMPSNWAQRAKYFGRGVKVAWQMHVCRRPPFITSEEHAPCSSNPES